MRNIINTIKTIAIKLSVKFNTKKHQADIESFLSVMNQYRNNNEMKYQLEMNRIYKATSKVNEKALNVSESTKYWSKVYLLQYLNCANSLNIHIDKIGERIIENAFSNKSTRFEINYTKDIISKILKKTKSTSIWYKELTASLNTLKAVL